MHHTTAADDNPPFLPPSPSIQLPPTQSWLDDYLHYFISADTEDIQTMGAQFYIRKCDMIVIGACEEQRAHTHI